MALEGVSSSPRDDGIGRKRPWPSVVGVSMVPDGKLQRGVVDLQRCDGCRAKSRRFRLLSGGFWPFHSRPLSAMLARGSFGSWLIDCLLSLGVAAAAALLRENIVILVAVGSKRQSLIQVLP